MRERTIRATGCHDCRLKEYVNPLGYYCKLVSGWVKNEIEAESFHPDCPMKEVTQ